MKKVFGFLKSYKLLSLVIIGLIAGSILFFTKQDTISHWVLGATTIIVVLPLIWDMVTTIRTGKYGIDILAATAMITSVVLGQYLAGIIIAFMLTGGTALEDFAENRAKAELTSLLNTKPTIAHLIKGSTVTDVKVELVKVGDKLSILPGEVIPVDCELIEGDTSVNEANITGESLPIDKHIGDQLLSGSVNIEGSLKVKVIHTAENSQFEQIIKLVKAASSTESPFIRLADKYSIPFTALSFFIAGSVWFISGHAIRFLEVIVVATPCPLLLAAPIALISGMSRAAKHGIIIKNGSTLERLAQVKTVGFDKTGTLTTGKPIIDKIETFNSFSEDDVLKYAATIEQNSNHALAKVIVDAAKAKRLKFQAAKQVKEIAGYGLRGRVQGKEILVGRNKLIHNEHVEIPEHLKVKSIKGTVSYVAIDKKLAGVITFTDQVRPEAKGMIKKLKDMGIKHILMVTGDSPSAAQYIARKLGITDIRAESLPVDKMTAIEGLEDRPVAFVGDGVNDAPVLTIADVGIALGAKGSTAASESADVVIMEDDVSKVASSLSIAKRTFLIAKQSILGGIILSIVLMLIFSTGKFKPVYGAVLQEVVDVIVIFNALRAHGAWQKLVDSKEESGL